ncbi:MAG: uncharacterized protein A8A55_0872 [Amphiamblys sp. WSBS2006]|nr:MAG: uncharacterized protein A8A55_0872 [Amphiamblys sp. WSBS2006]
MSSGCLEKGFVVKALENLSQSFKCSSKTLFFKKTKHSPVLERLLAALPETEKVLGLKQGEVSPERNKEEVCDGGTEDQTADDLGKEIELFWKGKLASQPLEVLDCLEIEKTLHTLSKLGEDNDCWISTENVTQEEFFSDLLFSDFYRTGFLLSLSARAIALYTKEENRTLLPSREEFLELLLSKGILSFLVSLLSKTKTKTRLLAMHLLGIVVVHVGRQIPKKRNPYNAQTVLACLVLEHLRTRILDDSPLLTPITAFYAKALLETAKPDLQRKIQKYILDNPLPDPHEMPLFAQMMFSIDSTFQQERLWMLRVLSVGVATENDVFFLRKNNIVSVLKSVLFDRSLDTLARSLCLGIVLKVGEKTEPDFQTWRAGYSLLVDSSQHIQ